MPYKAAWGRFMKLKYMEHACTGLSEAESPLEQSCMAMHGEHMEAQPPMGLKGDPGNGVMQ